eukprot:364933-Chlamydomonas_euryale.AAC.18
MEGLVVVEVDTYTYNFERRDICTGETCNDPYTTPKAKHYSSRPKMCSRIWRYLKLERKSSRPLVPNTEAFKHSKSQRQTA